SRLGGFAERASVFRADGFSSGLQGCDFVLQVENALFLQGEFVLQIPMLALQRMSLFNELACELGTHCELLDSTFEIMRHASRLLFGELDAIAEPFFADLDACAAAAVNGATL